MSRDDVVNVKESSPQGSPHPVYYASGSALDAQGRLYGLYRSGGELGSLEADSSFRTRIIEKMREDEKQPPQADSPHGGEAGQIWNRDRGWVAMGENTVSKLSLDETRKLIVQLTGTVVQKTNDLTKQTEEKQTMSNKTNRRVLNIQLLDNDAGLPVEHSLVAEFNGVVTEDSNEITVQEIISTGEVAERIKVHNEVRAKQIDLGILKTTGQKVNLLPVKLKDLTWNIK